MDICTVIAICGTAFILGIIFTLLLDKSLLRFKFNSGYRQAAQDILRDCICKDTQGHWHQLQMTWKDSKQPSGTFY